MHRLLTLLLTFSLAEARPWTDDVMYFVLTDRFHDGDRANNVPAGSDPLLHDPAQKDIRRYHGGDLRGLELAIQSGYFKDLGVTALWITPPVRNVWKSGPGGGATGYHGYWPQDFLDIDPHLTSATSLKGEPYPDSAEGRMQHYRDFVALAHSMGLKVVQDVVINHAGPVFFYDADGDGSFDHDWHDEWEQPFKRDGYHGNSVWGDIARWNLRRTQPDGPRELLGRNIATRGVLADMAVYGRKGFSGGSLGMNDGEQLECDFHSLRDFWTAPGSGHFDRLVDEFVEIHAFYLLETGVDGLRIDTVKHVHHGFWDAFTERLRNRLGPAAKDKLIFGEVYDSDPEILGRYTWRSDWPARTDPGLDGVLNFQLCDAARDYLRQAGEAHGHAAGIEKAMKTLSGGSDAGRPLFNPNPGLDGKNSREKSITFIENHDALNRFRVAGITAERSDLAQALVMSLPGIPCLYYGAEAALLDPESRPGDQSENGRRTLFGRDRALTPALVKNTTSFRTIARMAALRRAHPALRHGSFAPLWVDAPDSAEDDGIFAFTRETTSGQRLVLVFNAAAAPRSPTLPAAGFPPGTRLAALPVCGESLEKNIEVSPDGKLRPRLAASSAILLHVPTSVRRPK